MTGSGHDSGKWSAGVGGWWQREESAPSMLPAALIVFYFASTGGLQGHDGFLPVRHHGELLLAASGGLLPSHPAGRFLLLWEEVLLVVHPYWMGYVPYVHEYSLLVLVRACACGATPSIIQCRLSLSHQATTIFVLPLAQLCKRWRCERLYTHFTHMAAPPWWLESRRLLPVEVWDFLPKTRRIVICCCAKFPALSWWQHIVGIHSLEVLTVSLFHLASIVTP